MEATTLKRIIIYSVFAVILGLLLTLTPLIAFTETKISTYPPPPRGMFLEQQKAVEYAGSYTPKYSVADFVVLPISFTVASVVYIFFRRKMSIS
jgi:hypothetical protein